MDPELEEQMKMLEEMSSEEFGIEDTALDIPEGQISEDINTEEKKLNIKLHMKKINQKEEDSNVQYRFFYIDEHSVIRYRIIKFYEPNKDGNLYAVESPKGDGTFKPGARGIPRIPYNIPELIAQKDRVIFIVNGEDKVEILKHLGFVATTAAFSSPKKWDKGFNKYLVNGAYIVILADNKDDALYTKFLDTTLETIQEDFQNVARIDLADYFDYLGVNDSNVKTLTDLVRIVPKEEMKKFLSNIENQLVGKEN